MILNYALCNKTIAVSHLQSKSISTSGISMEGYKNVIWKIAPKSNLLGFVEEHHAVAESRPYFYYMLYRPSKIFLRLEAGPCSIYKIIPPDHPAKLFFNINRPLLELFCESVENILMNAFDNVITCTPPRIILSSCVQSKLSYHVIYPTVLFLNMSHMKTFVNTALSFLKDKFDHRVYTRYHLFHTFMSTKFCQNHPLIHHSNSFSRGQNSIMDKDIFFLSLNSYPQINFHLLSCPMAQNLALCLPSPVTLLPQTHVHPTCSLLDLIHSSPNPKVLPELFHLSSNSSYKE